MTIEQIIKLAQQDKADIVSKVLSKKGQFARVVHERPLKLRKEFAESNYGKKITDGTYRIGINYDHLSEVEKKRVDGRLPLENTGLRGVEWLVFPYLMKGADNKILVRLYTVSNGHKETRYELNGHEVEAGELIGMCLASEFSIKPAPPLINVNLDNIILIH